tara:strand:+ start:62559 stop:62714 length:156 start_codon:yes stop_codon:yes gene_type:complete
LRHCGVWLAVAIFMRAAHWQHYVQGGLRVSFVHDTQAQEVDKLISALDQVI